MLIATTPPGVAGSCVLRTNLEIPVVSFKAPVTGGMRLDKIFCVCDLFGQRCLFFKKGKN